MASIRKRGDSYQIRVSVGYDAKGKQITRTMTWKPPEQISKRQLQKELTSVAMAFEERCFRGYKISSIKFDELADEWFREYAEFNLRHNTFVEMKKLQKRVCAEIGSLRIDKITARQLQSFANSLARDGANKRTGKPLATKTIRHHFEFISDVFNYAVRMGIVVENPCSRVTIPKSEVKEKQIYSQAEMEQLLSKMDGAPLQYKVFFYLMAYTGFRRGEMLGLEWQDVDFQNNVISVRRTSYQTADRGLYTDTTKTRRSQRTLKISAHIMEMLRELKAEQDEEAQKLKGYWHASNRLFTKDNGEPLHPNTAYKWLKRFCARNDLPFYGLHSFRHFAASSLISAGVDVTTVSSALGHSNSGTTLNIYAHQFQTAQAKISEAMDTAFAFLSEKHGTENS